MKFEPWVTYRNHSPVHIPVEGPPCIHCKFWEPIVMFTGRQTSGVRLCHSENQWRDFSCYKEKENKDA